MRIDKFLKNSRLIKRRTVAKMLAIRAGFLSMIKQPRPVRK